jgi:C_GCAxxG_C_C family probable redox protein
VESVRVKTDAARRCRVNDPQALLIARVAETAYVYERAYHGCSQCVLGALQDCLGVGGKDSFKAATALAGGIARLGATCGALLGGLMGISLAFGREALEDSTISQGYARAMDVGGELCRRFQEEFGSTQCSEIQRSIFGRSFDLRDPGEREAFRQAGGYEKCPYVVAKAAELAAAVTLEGGHEPGGRTLPSTSGSNHADGASLSKDIAPERTQLMSRFHPTRILCPTDMSEVSRIAVRCGLAWARRFGAKAYVMAARELTLPPRYFSPEQIAALMRQAEAAEDQVRADLEDWVKEIGAEGVAVEAVVGPGPADRAILRAIEVVQPDLVVMGTHGRSGYNRFLLGSTTEKVIREIPVPLLTVREGCWRLALGAAEAVPLDIRRILCAADVPKETGANLATVAELARSFGAEVTVLHSLEIPGWLSSAPPDAREEARRRLKGLGDLHAGNLKFRVVVTEGPAYQRILEHAAREEADLVVVGGRRPGGDVPVFGSTAIRVMRRAPCPVLALPGGGE